MTVPLLITMIIIVLLKFRRNVDDKKKFFTTLLVFSLIFLIFYLLLNWLCEKEMYVISWVVALLPIVAYMYTGYMFINSEDCMKGINLVINSCLK
jgi:apolipoprotein N-acyltransferase